MRGVVIIGAKPSAARDFKDRRVGGVGGVVGNTARTVEKHGNFDKQRDVELYEAEL